MRTKLSLTLADAKTIAAAAEAYAESHDLRVSIAIVDESTYLQHLLRMDGAPYLSAEAATQKAQTAAEGGHPTTFFEEPLNAGRFSMLKTAPLPPRGRYSRHRRRPVRRGDRGIGRPAGTRRRDHERPGLKALDHAVRRRRGRPSTWLG